MKYNLLSEKIIKIQDDYKYLLLALQENIENEFSTAALDEINLFWKRNIGVVQLYLYNEFSQNDGYVFTAATFMDYEDKEQYPFLLLGKQHILDDPLCKYSSICNSLDDPNVVEILKEQIKLTLDDNIKILENCKNAILVLPLRLISQITNDSVIYKFGENAFASLFNEIETIENYFEKCVTFSDIIHYAKSDIDKWVVFSENDNKELSFQERFNQAIKDNADMIGHYESDAKAFFVMVYGCIQQAIDVIVSCVEYNCTPFIRYPVALNYILLLIETLSKHKNLINMRFKLCIANLIYRICDKEKLSIIGFDKFIDRIEKYNFNDKLFCALKEHNIDEETFTVKNTVPVIENVLCKLYEFLEDKI